MTSWFTRLLLVLVVASLGWGCAKSAKPEKASSTGTVLGAGATFPYPLYAKWGASFDRDQGIKVNYQSIGSGGGIQQIKAKTVDFGASDAPLTGPELDAAGLVQFPMVMGGVVPVVHLAGVESGKLVLDGPTLAALFLGDIKKWDDPRVKALNPDLTLPTQDVTVVHRADGSGTTWIFTNYLTKVSEPWKTKVGTDKAVSWPTGVGGKGNEGVAAYVQRVDGAIGYVESAYATQNKMNSVKLRNASGNAVSPTPAAFQAAAAHADWTKEPGFYVVLTDQPGNDVWPIVGASFILVHANQADPKKAEAILRFFDHAYEKGGQEASALEYVPMPSNVVSLVKKMWTEKIRSNGQPVWPAK